MALKTFYQFLRLFKTHFDISKHVYNLRNSSIITEDSLNMRLFEPLVRLVSFEVFLIFLFGKDNYCFIDSPVYPHLIKSAFRQDSLTRVRTRHESLKVNAQLWLTYCNLKARPSKMILKKKKRKVKIDL